MLKKGMQCQFLQSTQELETPNWDQVQKCAWLLPGSAEAFSSNADVNLFLLIK